MICGFKTLFLFLSGDMIMKKLIPLNVPWMISPSMANLKLMSEENGRTLVQFFGLFGFEPLDEKEATKSDLGHGTRGLKLDPSVKGGRHQLISLVFKNVGWLLRNPQHSDRDVIDETMFDWSNIRGRIGVGEGVAEWQKRCLMEWNNTRIAPNPSAYIVSNSDWNAREAEQWRLKHYLVLGESSSIEVLAEDFEWVSEGAISGW